MDDREKLLLEVLIENRQLKEDLAKANENSTYWWEQCKKVREKCGETVD